MRFFNDSNGSPCVEWEQAFGHHKRAWIQTRTPEMDWAKARGRKYLNVVRVDIKSSNPAGIPIDFPIFSELPDRQILQAFVVTVCAVTGCPVKNENSN